MMGIIVARSTTELGSNRQILQPTQLLFQTIDVNHYFLAQAGRRSGLPMGLGQHRNVLPLLGIVVQLLYQLLNHRIVNLLQCFLNRQGYAGIVDILRSQAEMDEFLCLNGEPVKCVYLFFDEVLYCLYVMVCRLLYLLDPCSILLAKATIDITQGLKQLVVKTFQLRQREFTKCNEILNFYSDTITDKRILGKVSCQFLCLVSVTAINRRDGGQHVQFHCFLIP